MNPHPPPHLHINKYAPSPVLQALLSQCLETTCTGVSDEDSVRALTATCNKSLNAAEGPSRSPVLPIKQTCFSLSIAISQTGVRGLWAVRFKPEGLPWEPEFAFHAFLLITVGRATKVLQTGEELMEMQGLQVDFVLNKPTLLAANLLSLARTVQACLHFPPAILKLTSLCSVTLTSSLPTYRSMRVAIKAGASPSDHSAFNKIILIILGRHGGKYLFTLQWVNPFRWVSNDSDTGPHHETCVCLAGVL